MPRGRWAYLFLIVAIRQKPKLDLTWLEWHVERELYSRPPAFFPRKTTLALQQFEQQQEEKRRAAREREEKLADDVDAIKSELADLSKLVVGIAARGAAKGPLRRQSTFDARAMAAAGEASRS